MQHILVLEDEELLRRSVARSLSSLPDVTVVEAGNFAEALRCIDAQRPDLIISDLNLPDRSGIELLSELSQRELHLPIIYMTAYLKSYRARLASQLQIDVLEKPVHLDELRQLVRVRLSTLQAARNAPPFGAADYLQIACAGRHSVQIDVLLAGKRIGQLVVHRGRPWAARDPLGSGMAAFSRLVNLPGAVVLCGTLRGEPEPANLDGSLDSLLLQAAVDSDHLAAGKGASSGDDLPPSPAPEAIAALPSAPASERSTLAEPLLPATAAWSGLDDPPRAIASEAPPPPARSAEASAAEFTTALEAGIDALLDKDYPRALAAFLRADRLRPGDPRITANLRRLEELGHRSP